MTCPALFLGPAGERAGNHENAQRDQWRHPCAEKPHVSNSRCYSRPRRWQPRRGSGRKSQVAQLEGLARGLFLRILHFIELRACSREQAPDKGYESEQ